MMTFDNIKKHNAEQISKYPGANLLFIPPFLADLAIGHGHSIDGYLITTWQYQHGSEMVHDVGVGEFTYATLKRPAIEVVEAPGDLCGNTKKLADGSPCPGCRACS